MLGLALAMSGVYAFLPVFWCLPARLLRGTAAAGGIAAINAVGSAGGFFGPSVLGVARDATGGFSGALALVAAITLGAAAATLRLRRAPAFAACAPGGAGRG